MQWGEFRAALLAHYERHRRALPWRGEGDPYRVLVSEMMLQQTRAETVARRYAGWLERFPGLESLAAAPEDEVLKAWEGLGYYRRARNLHRTAQLVRERADASLPSRYTELRELPGLGAYTAAAVASIAFGERVAAVDGNVRRVISRILDLPGPKPTHVRRVARELLDERRPGDWNQAMMELGATICTPRAPACGSCPVARWCAARAAGTQAERPGRAGRRRVREVTYALAVLHAGGHVLLERRPSGGLLGGMWAFPEREIAEPDLAAGAVRDLAAARGMNVVSEPTPLATCTHRFTHLHATYVPWAVEVERGSVVGSAAGAPEGASWIPAALPTSVALPVAQRRVLACFLNCVSNRAGSNRAPGA
jgi:A/G-specific adenine glycosylase